MLTCPVAHFVALALYDNAFGLAELRDAKDILALKALRGRKLALSWRQSILNTPILNTPILRESRDTASRELSGSVALRRLKTLGHNMGYRQPVTWYCFRRLVLNAVDGELA